MNQDQAVQAKQWEYCALVSHASEAGDDRGAWICRISYFTRNGVKTLPLREHGNMFPSDVFERAMAQLGAGEWELVSHQHELVRTNTNIAGEQFLATVHTGYSFSPFGVAYFKRQIEPDRKIDEPKVVIESPSE
jgi:hypothetical protein